jgi:hypothetical protein
MIYQQPAATTQIVVMFLFLADGRGPMMMMMMVGTTMMMPQTKDKPGDDSLSKKWGSAKKKSVQFCVFTENCSLESRPGDCKSLPVKTRVDTHGFASPHIPWAIYGHAIDYDLKITTGILYTRIIAHVLQV